MFGFYSRLLQSHPMRVQIATGGVLWSMGDILSQKLTRQSLDAPIDWERNLRLTFYGLAIASPMYALWYSRLDTVVNALFRCRS